IAEARLRRWPVAPPPLFGAEHETSMVMNFAGGICDEQGRRGYVEVGPEEVAAIDLSQGALLWRRAGVGRPIAATLDRLLTLDVAGNGFVVRFLDGQSGADTGQTDIAGMPAWAQTTGLAPDAVQVTAAEAPEGLQLRWRIRRPYRGGAPPPHEISASAANPVTGSLLVDPAAASVVSAAGPGPDRDIDPHQQGQEPNRSAATARADDRTFTLEIIGSELVLEAHAGPDNHLLWRLPL